MTYTGHVQNGVVVVDDSIALPEGAAVRIEVIAAESNSISGGGHRNWKGIFRDSGPVPSLEEIRAIRRQHWPS
jgi:hypothetical protein